MRDSTDLVPKLLLGNVIAPEAPASEPLGAAGTALGAG